MPYCPSCKFEYRSDVNKCPDCDEWLVNSLDNCKNKKNPDNFYTQTASSPPPEYSDELKKLMKSLPGSPKNQSGQIAPGNGQNQDNYQIDPDDEISRKLDQFQTWIEIAHFPSADISQVVAVGLESLQIPCVVIPGSHTGSIFGKQYGGVFKSEGVDILLVPEEFVDKADNEVSELLGETYKDYRTPNG